MKSGRSIGSSTSPGAGLSARRAVAPAPRLQAAVAPTIGGAATVRPLPPPEGIDDG